MAKTAPIVALSAVAVSSTTAYPSAAIPAQNILHISVQAVTAGSNPNGTLKVQFSNDNPAAGVAPSHWTDIPTMTVATTANGVYAITTATSQKFEICGNFIRAVYTNASGSGTISVNIEIFGI